MNSIIFVTGVLKERTWGGDYFKNTLNLTNESKRFGEYWTLSGHPEGESTVKNGVFQGLSVRDLYRNHPELFNYPTEPEFPILIKIIASNEVLSVQVHPSDAYAWEHERQKGKTEGWLILEAKKGSAIVLGHKAKNRKELEEAIQASDFQSILNYHPVYPGMFIPVEAGTIHAVGKGIVLLEIQQSSDVTYRLYDYNRLDQNGNLRPLHIEKSLDVIDYIPVEVNQHNFFSDKSGVISLWKNQFFEAVLYNIEDTLNFIPQKDLYYLGTVIEGKLTIEGQRATLGDSFIIPANSNAISIKGNGKMVLTNSR